MTFRSSSKRRFTKARTSLTNNAMIGKLEAINRQHSLYTMVNTFKSWDKDKSSAICFPEFLSMARNIPMLQGKDEAVLKEIFQSIDVDGSGAINMPEFRIL